MGDVQISEWTYLDWQAHEDQWTKLLEQSGQDPLFLSWEWMTIWWRVFGDKPTNSLCLLAAHRDGELVGIAPLYLSTTRRFGLSVRSLQFIGQSWRDGNVISSEYLDVIAACSQRDQMRAAFVHHLAKAHKWSEFTLSRSASHAKWSAAFSSTSSRALAYVRNVDPGRSYQADLSGGFEAFRHKLGQSTRRSVWHLRRRIEGKSRFECIPADEIEEAFAHLNRLHELRWGHPGFAGNRLQFHSELASRLAQRGELSMTRLTTDGKVVAVLFDVRKGSNQYNIKMAFDPNLVHGFSLGLILFGYALEHAAAQGVSTYDFLPGGGKKSDYKLHLSQARREVATLQFVRGALLPALYRCRDACGWLRDSLVGWTRVASRRMTLSISALALAAGFAGAPEFEEVERCKTGRSTMA